MRVREAGLAEGDAKRKHRVKILSRISRDSTAGSELASILP